MKPANPRILTINGGSSSIKFALFEAGDSLRRILEGEIDRIGLLEATLAVKGSDKADNFSRLVTAPPLLQSSPRRASFPASKLTPAPRTWRVIPERKSPKVWTDCAIAWLNTRTWAPGLPSGAR